MVAPPLLLARIPAMFRQFVTAYFLGAITFWPLFGLSVYVTVKLFRPFRLDATDNDETKDSEGEKDLSAPTLNQLPLQNMARFDPLGKLGALDLESDIEASCWIRLSPSFIALSESYDNAEAQPPKPAKPQSYTAKTSLQKFMSSNGFFSNSANSNAAGKPNTGASLSPSKSALSSAGSVMTAETSRSSASSTNIDSMRPKSIAKCPKYWAVVRGAQLQLFEDKTERKLLDLFALSQFVVSLWPQNLQEYELFYRRYPIVLLSRTDPEGLVSLDMYPGLPPRDAAYFYVENPVEKEDIYFALIEASKMAGAQNFDKDGLSLSLGPRDPDIMAQPVRVKKAEAQLLQSTIWNSDLPIDTQWLNALLGRIFLSLKDSKLAEDYLTRKFSTKLKPISDSSNIIGDIIVKQINSGSSAPHFSNIKLRELSPDGNLVLSAAISYSGGFRVNLATSVKLAAVTSLTTVEIPVELAATLRQLKGDIILRIKPAPSERIWYSFESMPEVDLHIEPAVYDTHISLSMVTKFIRSKILDSLRESLVMPYMDDLCFYDTTSCFYRGGIWEPPNKSKESREPVRNGTVARGKSKKIPFSERVEASNPSLRSPERSPGIKEDEAAATSSTLILGGDGLPLLAPRVRKRVPSSSSLDRAEDDSLSVKSASSTAAQRFSNWMRRKRTPLEPSSTAISPSLEPRTSLESTVVENAMGMTPGSVDRRERAPSTTQVTTTNATTGSVPVSSAREAMSNRLADDPSSDISGSSPKKPLASFAKSPRDPPIRRPVPVPAPLPLPVSAQFSAPSSLRTPEGEAIKCLDTPEMPTMAWRSSTETVLPFQSSRENSKENEEELEHRSQLNDLYHPKPSSLPAIELEEAPELDKLEPPLLSSSGPSTNTSNEVINGYIAAESTSRRNSLTSLHSRRSSQPLETGSVRSNGSNPGPVLPPRRRVVPLSNVAPEREHA